MIKKPLLAAEFDPSKAKFPYFCSPKVDGIRFVIQNGKALSRSLKPIRNNYVREMLEKYLPEGTDGELTCGKNFQSSTSAIMSIEGQPDFTVWVFDLYSEAGYNDRLTFMFNSFVNICTPFTCKKLYPKLVKNLEELVDLKTQYLTEGFEGIMLRSGDGRYKFGRSTVKENILLKWKDFVDEEATITGFIERLHNSNEKETNELGYSERSSSKAGMVPMDTLGALIVENEKYEVKIGTGFDDALRQEIWNNRESYLGKLVKFKYMVHGFKDKPRHPVFIGFRDKEDL